MNNQEFPLVSIITVNYNQTEVTCEFLESLRGISYPNIEIFVVDNASFKDDPTSIKFRYPEVNLIFSNENLGFAGGNNRAIRQSKGDYLLLINNDTVVDMGFLEPMVNKMRSNKIIGAVSPKVRYYYQPNIIQYAGFEPMSRITIRQHSQGFHQEDKGQFDNDRLTDFGFGAALLVSRSVIRSVGLMAEIFFLYYEEMDWMIRMRKAGFEIWYIHNSLVFHKDSVTTGSMSPLKTYFMTRGRLLYMRRNTYGFDHFLAIIYQLFIAIPKNIFTYLIKGRLDLLKAFLGAVSWHLLHTFSKSIYKNPEL